MSEQEKPVFEGWAVLELMGHRRLGGFVREAIVAGAPFVRIDVPAAAGDGSEGVTQFYSPAAVYCITPTTEAIAVALARTQRPAPVQRYELPELGQGAGRAPRPIDVEPDGGDGPDDEPDDTDPDHDDYEED